MELFNFIIIALALTLSGGFNVMLLVYHQVERKKSIEREMKLIKAILCNNVQELQMAEESPGELQDRLKIENDLVIKEEKIRQKDPNNKIFDKIPI